MQTWMKVTLAGVVPAMGMLVLHDTVQGFYGPKWDLPLSYVVVEEDDPAEEETLAEATSDDGSAAEAPAEEETVEAPLPEETLAEDVAEAPAEEAPIEDTAEAPTEETPAEDLAETPAEETPDPTEAADDSATMVAMLSDDEMQAGESAARACASCHQFERERNSVGPHLVGLAERPVGSIDGFRYSDALMALNEEGAVWNATELQSWLEDPDAYAPGTKMMFNVRDPEERRLIAGWLTQREQ